MPAVSLVPHRESEVAPLVDDLKTAAKLAGCSDRHLRKFFADGPAEYLPKLPVCRIGGRVLIRRSALEAWLAAVEQQSTSQA